MLDVHALMSQPCVADDSKSIAKNELVYCSGAEGRAWQVVSGVVRLDRFIDDGPHFSGLALPGDVIGVEAAIFGRYADEAHALTPCVLVPWTPEAAQESSNQWLSQLADHQRRFAQILNLRCGAVEERMRRLFALMQSRHPSANVLDLPSLRNISEVLDITIESASRVLSKWRQQGWLGARKRGKAEFQMPDEHFSVAA